MSSIGFHLGRLAGRKFLSVVREKALDVLWEARDRFCGKRLKPLIPALVEAMERQGHLQLGSEIRAGLPAVAQERPRFHRDRFAERTAKAPRWLLV